jgi:predicted DCC family thiol-disulfide oxidoreductase YuxK
MTVVFDGDCGICTSSANYISKRDKAGKFRVVPSQAIDRKAEFPMFDESVYETSVIFRRNGRVYTESRAVFEIMKSMGGIFSFFGFFLANKFISFLFRPFYRLVARNRAKISQMLGMNACKI